MSPEHSALLKENEALRRKLAISESLLEIFRKAVMEDGDLTHARELASAPAASADAVTKSGDGSSTPRGHSGKGRNLAP